MWLMLKQFSELYQKHLWDFACIMFTRLAQEADQARLIISLRDVTNSFKYSLCTSRVIDYHRQFYSKISLKKQFLQLAMDGLLEQEHFLVSQVQPCSAYTVV